VRSSPFRLDEVVAGGAGSRTVRGMDETTRTRIDNYRPTVSLPGDAALDAVRDAVRRADPSDVRQAALLLHAAARHVHWATANGYGGSLRKLFAPACVAASVAAAKAASTSSVSPYRSRLNQLSAAVLGGGRSTARKASTQGSSLTPPHTGDELAALRVAGRGMNLEEHRDLEAALALGVGAGLIGPLASSVEAEHVTHASGHTVVCGPGFGPVVVREPWGKIIREMAELRAIGPLTNYYTTAGRQRVRRGLGRSQHVPDFQAHRLRTGWVTELLSAGVPLDVVTELAGITLGALYPYVALSSPPPRSVRPSPDSAPFAAFERQPAASTSDERRVTDAMSQQQPRVAAVAAWWSSDDADPLRELVCDRAATGKQAKDLLTALFVLLEWAIEQPGLPLRPAALLKETTLGRWAAVQRAEGLADASVAAYLSRLRRLLAEDVAMGARGCPEAPAVYGDDERQTLLAASAGATGSLSARLRRLLAAHVHAQLGGGIAGHEVGRLLGSDVRRSHHGLELDIRSTSPRLVPVIDIHAEALERLAEEAADGVLTGVVGHDLKRHRAAISEQLGFEFDPRRLQATWIADQVRAGAGAQALILGTGLTLAALAPQVEAACGPRSLAELVAWSGWPATARCHG